jgi:hypothetical protein
MGQTMLKQQPLTNSRNEEIILYDMTALLEVAPHVAQGYVALLTPTLAGKSQADQENAYTLAFLALTEGNVVDTCFGISTYTTNNDDHKGAAFARRAKNLIGLAGDVSDNVSTLAVDTYRQVFETLVDMHQKRRRLFFLWRCFMSGSIQRRGKDKIRKAFTPLEEALQSST